MVEIRVSDCTGLMDLMGFVLDSRSVAVSWF